MVNFINSILNIRFTYWTLLNTSTTNIFWKFISIHRKVWTFNDLFTLSKVFLQKCRLHKNVDGNDRRERCNDAQKFSSWLHNTSSVWTDTTARNAPTSVDINIYISTQGCPTGLEYLLTKQNLKNLNRVYPTPWQGCVDK